MWIAKNDITGKTYGNKFKSIYDCQKFIDTDLCILQYEWRRVCYLDNSTFKEEDYQAWVKKNYPNGVTFVLELTLRIQYGIETLVNNDFLRSQNVIRCWNIEQKRFAEGLDF